MTTQKNAFDARLWASVGCESFRNRSVVLRTIESNPDLLQISNGVTAQGRRSCDSIEKSLVAGYAAKYAESTGKGLACGCRGVLPGLRRVGLCRACGIAA